MENSSNDGLTLLKVWACGWGPFYRVPENEAHRILTDDLRGRCRRGESGVMTQDDAKNLLAAEGILREVVR